MRQEWSEDIFEFGDAKSILLWYHKINIKLVLWWYLGQEMLTSMILTTCKLYQSHPSATAHSHASKHLLVLEITAN